MTPLYLLNRLLTRAVVVLIVAMVAVMLCALAAQVLLRYMFSITLSWSEELSLALFTWTVLLSAALGVREGFHVRMVLVLDRLPASFRRQAERFIHLVTVVFGLYLAWAGYDYVRETQGMTSAAIAYPIGWLYAATPVCGALIALFGLESTVKGTIPTEPGALDNV